jgi:diguanylate cyclase (GGDEF)-like protein
MQELYDRSIRDELTGLFNRRGATDVFNKPSARCGASNAAFLIDIDNLKMINDVRGHVTGDAVIVRTAEAIRECIRKSDACARIGDEFMILAPDCESRRQGHRTTHIRQTVQTGPAAGRRPSQRFDRHCRV